MPFYYCLLPIVGLDKTHTRKNTGQQTLPPLAHAHEFARQANLKTISKKEKIRQQTDTRVLQTMQTQSETQKNENLARQEDLYSTPHTHNTYSHTYAIHTANARTLVHQVANTTVTSVHTQLLASKRTVWKTSIISDFWEAI